MKYEDAQLKIKKLLHREWATYQNLVRTSQKNPSTHKIHSLRVQVHRLLAALELAICLREYSRSQKIINQMTRTQRKTSALRDLQVELLFLKRNPYPNMKSFKKHLEKHKIKVARQTRHFLSHININKQKYFLKKLKGRLDAHEPGETLAHIKLQIKSCVRHAFLQFDKKQKLGRKIKPAHLHDLRTMAKHLRYLSEAAKVIIGTTDVQLPHIKKVQVALGRTQDDAMFIKNIDRYLEKNHRNKNKNMKMFRSMISSQQKELMKSASKYVYPSA